MNNTEKQSISATIIADSINECGNRLTSFVLVFPRIVLAEFNTHRMLSRNSSSSRAVPFETMLKRVETDPFIPIKWMRDHKGMQGSEYFDGYADVYQLKEAWLKSKDSAVAQAKQLSELGLTKQIVNRLLEPFMWHTVIATATEWENFFALRAHPAAEIHIAKLAEVMLEAYNTSTPKLLKAGEWHIPFGKNIDEDKLGNYLTKNDINFEWDQPGEREILNAAKIKIATARCARVSYINYEGKDDYAADVKLFDTLSSLGHWSPFEHCARAQGNDEYNLPHGKKREGNFKGWTQLRKLFEGENKSDARVKKNILV